MGDGFTVSADTNTATTTITENDTLTIAGGTNVTTVSNPDGTITINATDTNTTYSTATSSTLGLVKIGYSENGKNYPVELSSGKMFVNVPWTDTDTNTTYSEATSSTLGLVKIGYSENGKNYPVELSSGKMFVNVPWTDTDTNTQLSTEQVQDIVGGMVSGNTETNISVTYNDSTGKLNFSSTNTNTNILSGGTITGDVTVNGDMTFEDGHKLELGTGADLDLYHTSNNSYIDNNTGNLYIRCNPSGEIHLRPKESENGIIVRNDGKAELYFDNAKKLETVTGGVNVTGTMTASADVVAYSDERLKSDIKTLDGSKVYDMRGVSFIKDNKQSSGVIAQELEKIAPELVNNEGEYKAVAYGNVVGYLIEAIKDLKAEIEILKNGSTK